MEKHVAKKHSGKSPPPSSEKVELQAKKNKNEVATKEMTADSIDEVIDEFAKDVEQMENKNLSSPNKVNKPKVKKLNRPVPERNWQECPYRNWAAEFGYGGKSSIGPTRDILSRMALTFKIGGEDEEDTDDKTTPGYDSGVSVDDEDKIFRTRGFKGNVKASLNRAPRTLSSSSLRTRKRMEALMRKAREFMKKNKGNSGNNEKTTGGRTTTPITKKITKITNNSTKKSNTTVAPVVITKDTTSTTTAATVTTSPTIEKQPSEDINSKEKEDKNKPSVEEKQNKEPEVVVAQEVEAEKPTEKEPEAEPQPEPEPEKEVVEPEVVEEDLHLELEDGDLEEEEEEEEEEDEDFDGISDGSDDDDNDGLLIPLENGCVCEKRMADPEVHSYTTHFWSPDGQRHGSLSSIKTYGTKNKLKLNMFIFERALKTNPHTK